VTHRLQIFEVIEGIAMKNLKIGVKMFITFGIIIAVFLITVAVSVSALSITAKNFTTFFTGPYEVTNKASDLRTSIQSAVKNLGYATMTEDAAGTVSYIQASGEDLAAVEEGLVFLKENFKGDASLVTKAEQILIEAENDLEQVYALARENRNEEASSFYFRDVMPDLVQVSEYLDEIDSQSGERASNTYNEAQTQRTGAMVLLIVLSVIGLLITVSLAVYLTRSVNTPVLELEAAAKRIAEGHLQVSVAYQSKDELGVLADSFRMMSSRISRYMGDITEAMQQMASGNLNVRHTDDFAGDFIPVQNAIRTMLSSLNDTMMRINQSADQVSSGADQVSSGAQALSQGATEQASSVEELAATISEISSQVNASAQSAKDASNMTVQVSEAMTESDNRMQDMVRAMNNISETSRKINNIIDTIESIAFQTNILALNAAVEAARAGTAGKGFAVVANEVRSLASKSGEASKDTAELIKSAILAVDEGTQIAEDTAKTLQDAVQGAQTVAGIITKISDASASQADAISQVTVGIDQISSVVQTNSATAEQSAAASEELSSQAQVLKSLVSKFKLRDGSMPESAPTSFSQYGGGSYDYNVSPSYDSNAYSGSSFDSNSYDSNSYEQYDSGSSYDSYDSASEDDSYTSPAPSPFPSNTSFGLGSDKY